MKIYLQSLGYELWNIVKAPYTKPTTNYNAWSEEQKKSVNLDAKAINVVFFALNKKEFNRVSKPDLQIKYSRFYRERMKLPIKLKNLKSLFLFTYLNSSK